MSGAAARGEARARTSSVAVHLARALLPWLLPLALLGPSLLPGKRFLPQLPVGLEPLASESPAEARRAWERANYLASDALFPLLTDASAMREQMRDGILPLWEPKLGLGMPLAAGSLFGPWYPPHWIAFALPPEIAFGWIAFLDLALAGLGLWLFLERRGASLAACALGCFALQGGGWAAANLHDGPKLEAALWLPWALWAIEGLARRRRGAAFALVASLALSFLAGFPPVAIFAACAALAFAAWRNLVERREPLACARACGFAVLGVASAAIQLVPTAEASRESVRVPQSADAIAEQRLPLASTLTLAAPHLFGAPTDPVFAPHDATAWWLARRSERAAAENANALEWQLFAGVAALALAAAALVAAPRKALFPALAVLAALGFAQGWPPFALGYRVPGLDLGAPGRATCVSWVALAWLAALGLDALLARGRRASAVVVACSALALAAGVRLEQVVGRPSWPDEAAATIAGRQQVPEATVRATLPPESFALARERLAESAHVLALSGAALGVAALAVAFALRRRSLAALPFALLVLVEGGCAAWPHLAPRDVGSAELWPSSAAMRALATAAGDGRVVRIDSSASGVDDVLALARPNLPQAYGVADLTPYAVFTPRALVELVSAVDPGARYRSGISRLSESSLAAHPALDGLHVTAVLSRVRLAQPRLEPVLERDGFCVYRRTDVPPLARVVASAIAAPTDESALAVLASRRSDPARQVVFAPGAEPSPPAEGSSGGDVRIVRPRPDALEISVRGSSGGWLAIAEAWYPGWRATLSTAAERAPREVPIARADHACRAVAIPAGDCDVRLEYAPGSLRLGAALTALALVAALALELARERAFRALS